MRYPDDFNTPAFPAGPRIAVSRFMAIGTMIVFALMIVTCVIMGWVVRGISVKPYVVSLDSRTGNWNTVAIGSPHGVTEITPEFSVRQAAVGRFAIDWLTISGDAKENAMMWRSCDRVRDCSPGGTRIYGSSECAIYCAASDELYTKFTNVVMPDYSARAAVGDVWHVRSETVKVFPLDATGETWQVYATVSVASRGDMQVVAYVNVERERDTSYYPQTLGGYIADFNAYRID